MGEAENRSLIRNIWMAIAMIFSFVGNILLIMVITRNGRFHNVTNAYNLALSVSDLVKVLSFIPLYLVFADLKTWPFGKEGCKLFNVIFSTSFGVSILILMCLSYERYHLILKPARKQLTVRQAVYLIISTITISLIIGCLLVIPFYDVIPEKYGLHCVLNASKDWHLGIIINITILSQGIPGIFFLIIHALTARKLRRDAGAMEPREMTLAARNRFRRNVRAIKILVIEALSWVACLVPYLVITLIHVDKFGSSVKPFSWEYLLINCALVLQTVVNPALHFVLIKEFRNELRVMWNSVLKKLTVNQVEPTDTEITEFRGS